MNRTHLFHASPKRQRSSARPAARWSESRWSESRWSVSGAASVRSRAGFTLVELMMVIVVIGILAGLVLTAGQRAIVSARITSVTTDIKNLEQAIAEFKREYGVEPPSYVLLYENGSSSTTGATNRWPSSGGGTLARISRSRLRGIWPQFDFAGYSEPADYNGNGNTSDPGEADGAIDINGNGTIDDVVIHLNGSECLVFFLGGVFNRVDVDGDGTPDWVPQGFSSNPENPFGPGRNSQALIVNGGNRKGPFYEFDPARFTDVDSDGFPEYLDPLPSQVAPYQYFSSYDGTGYLPRGLDGQYGPPFSASGDETDNETLPNGLVSHYTMNEGNTSGPGYPTPLDPKAVHKPQGFQIISPGYDGQFGVGGAYVVGQPIPSSPDPTGQRVNNLQYERDNITNFTNGTLE